ncbi:Cu-processing system ATP-binding protein [Spirosomataceae bacterium TFI 002]|nr:Cu-processing system ATP-binding protein [Spirosomataceae bacterium TFI 002]
MIQFKNITKSFGKLSVLKDFSATFSRGQSIAIMGPNGSGKTTLIKILLGMVIPDAGELEVNGKSVKREFAYRGDIGYMPQISNYPPNLRVNQLFEMMKDIRKAQGWHGELDEELIENFEINEISNKALGTLSGGTKQKVSAALALLFDPKILVLDEPTAGLDPLAAELLKAKILKERNQGKLVIITSHIMADLEELTDHILYMQDGRVQFFKKLEELRTEVGETTLMRIVAKLMHEKKRKVNKEIETMSAVYQ